MVASENVLTKLLETGKIPTKFPRLQVQTIDVTYIGEVSGHGNWQSAFPGEEPVITQGFQMPEFRGTAPIIWSIAIVTPSLLVRMRSYSRNPAA